MTFASLDLEEDLRISVFVWNGYTFRPFRLWDWAVETSGIPDLVNVAFRSYFQGMVAVTTTELRRSTLKAAPVQASGMVVTHPLPPEE